MCVGLNLKRLSANKLLAQQKAQQRNLQTCGTARPWMEILPGSIAMISTLKLRHVTIYYNTQVLTQYSWISHNAQRKFGANYMH
jgi:hypothetical protein